MAKRVFRILFTIFGLLMGAGIANMLIQPAWLLPMLHLEKSPLVDTVIIAVVTIIFGLISYLIFPLLAKGVYSVRAMLEKSMESFRLIDIVLATGGFVLGLLIATLLSVAIAQIPFEWVGSTLTVITYVLLGYLGISIPLRKRDEILNALNSFRKERAVEREITAPVGKKMGRKKIIASNKILDSSVLIDGRILEIGQSGFLEGCMVIPIFVIKELQLIADSSDSLKRERGRRGLDIISQMQQETPGLVQIVDEDFEDVIGVDAKLVRLAKENKCKVVTNDFNLNKVATVQGVDVLNINALSNAVKPIMLPGEVVTVKLIKQGKEQGQAVAYLEDGTMIVVENGGKMVGKDVAVMVSSVLQTAAGRMIFARIK